jgi:two-component system, OmpR family, response regulator
VKPPLRTVLLVEDNADIRTIVKAALETIGKLQVRACASGEDALIAVRESPPQLVLLDVMMPGMDGPGVLARLREQPETAAIPVVFLTAKAAVSEFERLRALGAADVLTKPFDPMKLHEQVKAAWEKA